MTKPFKKIAVIGTGTLGAQIAMLASNAGYSVTIFDQQAGAFEAMMAKLQADLEAKQVDPFIPLDRWPACPSVARCTVETLSFRGIVQQAPNRPVPPPGPECP